MLNRRYIRNRGCLLAPTIIENGGGRHSTDAAFLLLTQWPRVRFSALLKIYFNDAEIYQQRWLEDSGPRLENIDRTQLVLASC